MSIAKFRKLRLITTVLIWFIVSLISLIETLDNYKTINLSNVLYFLTTPCALLLIILIVYFALIKLLPKENNSIHRYANFTFDTFVFVLSCVIVYYILIVLYCGFLYLLCELGSAPAPQ